MVKFVLEPTGRRRSLYNPKSEYKGIFVYAANSQSIYVYTLNLQRGFHCNRDQKRHGTANTLEIYLYIKHVLLVVLVYFGTTDPIDFKLMYYY